MHNVFIIAEAGVNHNGSVALAKKMIEAASTSGADAIKFQTFRAEKMVSKQAPKADYQKNAFPDHENQYEMLKHLELDGMAHSELLDYCKQKKIIFLSSPFDLESISLLCSLHIDIFKIPSGEITNLPYLRTIGFLNKKIILSTGMAGLYEINDALQVLINSGTSKKNITLLHCTTAYPALYKDVHLRAMLTLHEHFGTAIGYSDHTIGIEVPIAAVALGATVIEKHFTLDRTMKGPDHTASLEPEELKTMVNSIRNIEKALGKWEKRPTQAEKKMRDLVRKSITASRDIRKGEVFKIDNIAAKRPGTGISPMRWDEVIGKEAKKHFKKDDMIEL